MKRIELDMEQKEILRALALLQEQIHSSIDNTPKMMSSKLLKLSQMQMKLLVFYTGPPSHDWFTWFQLKSSFLSDSFPSSNILTSADILLLVLMKRGKRRLDVPHRDLSYGFDIAPSLVGSLLTSVFPAFGKQVSFFIHWQAGDKARQKDHFIITAVSF